MEVIPQHAECTADRYQWSVVGGLSSVLSAARKVQLEQWLSAQSPPASQVGGQALTATGGCNLEGQVLPAYGNYLFVIFFFRLLYISLESNMKKK